MLVYTHSTTKIITVLYMWTTVLEIKSLWLKIHQLLSIQIGKSAWGFYNNG